MRVCMISPEYAPNIYGGLGRHVTDLAGSLAARGIEVHVVTYGVGENMPPREQRGNLYVHRVQFPFIMDGLDWDCITANANCAYVWKAFEVINTYNIDILHAQDWGVCQAILALRELVSVPIISTIHLLWESDEHPLFQYRNTIILSLIESSDILVCCSKYMKEELEQRYSCGSKTMVVPNAIFLDRFPFIESPGCNVLFIGRLVPRKGVHELIKAFQLIHRQMKGDLIIVGSGSLSYERSLRELALELKIDNRVQFRGKVEHNLLSCYMKEAGVFAIPSLYEPFGIVALEAMASGIPVVAYDVGGLSEIFQDGTNGFKVRAGDVKGLANRLRYICEHVHEFNDLRSRARQDVESHYTWDRIADMTSSIYGRLVR